MDIRPGNAQWQGTRSEQQDAFGFVGFEDPALSAHGGVLVVLADGMGGMSRGRQAARLACERMMAVYAEKSQDEPVAQALERALIAANQAVYRLALEGEGEGEVGTTLVAAVVRGAELHWVGVGDSRLYRYRAEDDSLTACTTDHNFANQLLFQVAAGALDPVEAAAHPDRQALTSFLGLEVIPEIDRNLHPVHLAPGDRLLLCSDGVHGVLPEADLRQLLRQDAQAAADALIGAVKALGLPEQDNATAAVVGIEGAAAPEAVTARTGSAGPSVGPSQPRRGLTSLGLTLSALLLLALGVAIGLYLRAGGKHDPGHGSQAASKTPVAVTDPPSSARAGPRAPGQVHGPDGAGERAKPGVAWNDVPSGEPKARTDSVDVAPAALSAAQPALADGSPPRKPGNGEAKAPKGGERHKTNTGADGGSEEADKPHPEQPRPGTQPSPGAASKAAPLVFGDHVPEK